MGRKSGLKREKRRLKATFEEIVKEGTKDWDPEDIKIFLEKTWRFAKAMGLEKAMFDEIKEYEEGGDLVLGDAEIAADYDGLRRD